MKASLVDGYTRPALDSQGLQFLPNYRVAALQARQAGFTRPVAEVEAALLRERRQGLPGQHEQEIRPRRPEVTTLD